MAENEGYAVLDRDREVRATTLREAARMARDYAQQYRVDGWESIADEMARLQAALEHRAEQAERGD